LRFRGRERRVADAAGVEVELEVKVEEEEVSPLAEGEDCAEAIFAVRERRFRDGVESRSDMVMFTSGQATAQPGNSAVNRDESNLADNIYAEISRTESTN
jgi:hypothetical protein